MLTRERTGQRGWKGPGDDEKVECLEHADATSGTITWRTTAAVARQQLQVSSHQHVFPHAPGVELRTQTTTPARMSVGGSTTS